VAHHYSRAQAIADGVLVDVSALHGATVAEAGFGVPVAMSAAAYRDFVALHPEAAEAGCTLDGRIWDVLYMARAAMTGLTTPAREPGSSSLIYKLIAVLPGEPVSEHNREPNQLCAGRETTLKAVVGPGDTLEPVLTIMLPTED
jgi:hypothetical protein